MIDFKAGRLPHDPRPERLLLSAYRTSTLIAPASADWISGVKRWPMALNDNLGDCTAAGAAHVAQQVTWYGQDRDAPVADTDTLAFYEAISGYRPGDPGSDVGATLQDALNRWRSAGIGGNRIAAFAQVKAADLDTIRFCIATFGAVYCGMWMPQSAMDQFDAGRPWTKVRRSANLGGHCVPVMAYGPYGFTCVTYGRAQLMDTDFFLAQIDEVWVPISAPWVRPNGASPSGLNTAALNADFTQLTGQPGPFPAAPQPVDPIINPDVAFAGILHRWIQHDGIIAAGARTAAQTWLNAKGL